MSDEKEEKKAAILGYLEKQGKCFVKEIAKGVGFSVSTTSKYLLALETERKVKREEMRPYVYYELVRSSGG